MEGDLKPWERSSSHATSPEMGRRRGSVSGKLLMGLTLCTSLAACALTLFDRSPLATLASPPKVVTARGPLTATELAARARLAGQPDIPNHRWKSDSPVCA